MHTQTEENYLKAIYHLSGTTDQPVNTSSIAGSMSTTPASVTDMLKRLADKGLIVYERYRGVRFTGPGEKVALQIIRKHRLWEVFLTDVLKFKWDEVHTMAEELEHVSSDELIQRLDAFLGHPEVDPHGDPIPDRKGIIAEKNTVTLSSGKESEKFIITGVNDDQPDFLRYLEKSGLTPGITVRITEIQLYDKSMDILINEKSALHISNEVAKNLLVKKL